ncbi:unnamed protein product, partial [Polarella glacialis]
MLLKDVRPRAVQAGETWQAEVQAGDTWQTRAIDPVQAETSWKANDSVQAETSWKAQDWWQSGGSWQSQDAWQASDSWYGQDAQAAGQQSEDSAAWAGSSNSRRGNDGYHKPWRENDVDPSTRRSQKQGPGGYSPGERVDVSYNGRWYEGEVQTSKKKKVHVTVHGKT